VRARTVGRSRVARVQLVAPTSAESTDEAQLFYVILVEGREETRAFLQTLSEFSLNRAGLIGGSNS